MNKNEPMALSLVVPEVPSGDGDPAFEDEAVFCGELDIRIDRDGIWYYHGSPIGRKELVCLFASMLIRDDDGFYWLVSPMEIGLIDVEDAPFIAVELFVAGTGRECTVSLRTNVDEIVTIDADHPLVVRHNPDTGEPRPYVALRDGLEALVSRAVYYDLVELGADETVDGKTHFGFWSAGSFFAMGEPTDDEDGNRR